MGESGPFNRCNVGIWLHKGSTSTQLLQEAQTFPCLSAGPPLPDASWTGQEPQLQEAGRRRNVALFRSRSNLSLLCFLLASASGPPVA